jgi:hypothetical protein
MIVLRSLAGGSGNQRGFSDEDGWVSFIEAAGVVVVVACSGISDDVRKNDWSSP